MSKLICSECEKDLYAQNRYMNNQGNYTCLACKNGHKLSNKGLVTNHTVMQLLEANSKQVLLKNTESLMEICVQLTVEETKRKLQSNCEFVENEIDVALESRKEQLNKQRVLLQDKIAEYKAKCLHADNSIIKKLNEFKPVVESYKNVCSKLKLKIQDSVNQEDFEQIQSELAQIRTDLNKKLETLKDTGFDRMTLHFDVDPIPVSSIGYIQERFRNSKKIVLNYGKDLEFPPVTVQFDVNDSHVFIRVDHKITMLNSQIKYNVLLYELYLRKKNGAFYHLTRTILVYTS
jgi:hypothetical protein